MNREAQLAVAVAGRCEVICDAVGLRRSTDLAFVRHVLEGFPVQGHAREAERAWRRRAYLLTQAFHCRLPAPGYDDVLRASFAQGADRAVYETLVGCDDFHSSPQAAAELISVPDPATVMDVTSTVRLDFTSGIQRVVRCLASHLNDVAPGSIMVRWDDRTHGFVPLTAAETESVVAPVRRPSAAATEPSQQSRAGGVFRALGRLAAWPRRRIERKFRKRRERAAVQTFRQPAVFLWRQPLLLPELVGGELHIEAIRLLSDAAPLRSTLVFYDALPIRRPELFAPQAHSAYLRSLSLIRHVGGISCISSTVRDDLVRLLETVPRHLPAADVDVHYLGADFPVRSAVAPTTPDQPIVLCVGTIEPRKNQTRILRAMIKAQSAGARFTGVFVGNAGWLNGAFRREFATAVAAGHILFLHEHLDDAKLDALYRQASFTVYCSLDEGFGLPIIESLGRGRPCITSDRGSMREIAERTGGCELVDPEDTAEIAAAIHRLAADVDARNRLTREATAATWPSWRDYTETLLGFARTVPAAASRAA